MSFIFLFLDIGEISGTWNLFSKNKLQGDSILDAHNKFAGKIYVHRFATSFILRYRALRDKLMGLIILIGAPELYEKFNNGKGKRRSRKAAFQEISQTKNLLTPELEKSIITHLENFDNSFRTSEAHGVSSIKKWTLSMSEIHKTPQIDLLGYWNIANMFIAELMKHYKFIPTSNITAQDLD